MQINIEKAIEVMTADGIVPADAVLEVCRDGVRFSWRDWEKRSYGWQPILGQRYWGWKRIKEALAAAA